MTHDRSRARTGQLAAQTRRLLVHLRDLVADTDLPHRVLERRAELAPGYLAQLLAGHVDLKMAHALRVLDAVGVPAAEFFRALHAAPAVEHDLDLSLDEDVARVYGFGIESLEHLRSRLERFEDALGGLDVGEARET